MPHSTDGLAKRFTDEQRSLLDSLINAKPRRTDKEVAFEFTRMTRRPICHNSVGCRRRNLGVLLGRDKSYLEMSPLEIAGVNQRYQAEREAKIAQEEKIARLLLNTRPIWTCRTARSYH
jgi:hypothetical protein